LPAIKNIRKPGFGKQFKVVLTSNYEKGRDSLIASIKAKHADLLVEDLVPEPSKWVVMFRNAMTQSYEEGGIIPTSDDAWCWSMWSGYLKNDSGKKTQEWFDKHHCPAKHLHTSGHASVADLRAVANAINAKQVIPVHGTDWAGETDIPNLRHLKNGEPLCL